MSATREAPREDIDRNRRRKNDELSSATRDTARLLM